MHTATPRLRPCWRSVAVCLAVLLTGAAPLKAAEAGRSASSLGLQVDRETTYITGPLDARGYPDYVAALNQKLSAGVAPEENFWVLMWPALGNAERSREEYIREVETQLGVSIAREPRILDPLRVAGVAWDSPAGKELNELQFQSMTRPWTRVEFPDIARWVDSNAEVLAEVHEACLRPKAYAPVIAGSDESPQLIAILLPHIQSLRSVARLLASRAMLRLGEEDVDGAWQDLLDMHRIAKHSEGGWTLIEALVGYAIRGIALQPTVHWMSRCGLSPEELDNRWSALQPLLATTPLTVSIDTERLMYLDTTLALMSGQVGARKVSGLIEPQSISSMEDDDVLAAVGQLRNARQAMFQLLLLGSDVNQTLRYGNRMYDQLIQALQPNTHRERTAALAKLEERVRDDSLLTQSTGELFKAYLFSSREDLQTMPGRMLTGMLMPAVTQVEKAYTRVEAYALILQTAYQAQRHFLQTGEMPSRIEVLIGVGNDPFSGESLQVKSSEGGLMVYSVGINGRNDSGRTYGEGEGCDDLRALLPLTR